jgi:fatty-acyl-CoA synthase
LAAKGGNMVRLTTSYVQGASDVPLIGLTMGAAIDQVAAIHGESTALVSCHQNIRWSWAQFRAEVDKVAVGLLAIGLRPGERIGLWAPNNAEWLLSMFAAAKAGLILVSLNPAYRISEIEYCLNKVSCRALIVADRLKSSDYLAMLRELLPESVDSCPGALSAVRVPSLTTLIHIGPDDEAGFLRFSDLAGIGGAAQYEQLTALAARIQFDDPVNIQFTSGTTGQPKATTLTHHGVINNIRFTAYRCGVGNTDRILLPVPMFHIAGMASVILAVLSGCAVVMPSETFDPIATMQAAEQERCTYIGAVPTMFVALLNHPEFSSFDLGSLRKGYIGGAPCPLEVMRRLISDDMKLTEITIVFGMTETSPVSFQTRPDDTLDRRVSTCGQVHPHVEVKIVDAEGRIVPVGEPGEILVRGYLVMRGYWGDPERTADAIDAAGWMHTGDLGTLDAEGYCNIVGRAKDMLIRGGENIFPREIEEFLYTHPAIDDVHVFGVPDNLMGEEVAAWIRLKSGVVTEEDDIRTFCRGRIAHYKIPRYIRFVDQFPTTASGKVQKFRMRDAMVQELGLKILQTA